MRAEEKQTVRDEAQRLTDARGRYRTGIAAAIREAQQLADVLEPAVGELSSDTALEAWRREVIIALKTASHAYVHGGGQ